MTIVSHWIAAVVVVAAVSLLLGSKSTHAFIRSKTTYKALTPRQALWRHWIPVDEQRCEWPLPGNQRRLLESLDLDDDEIVSLMESQKPSSVVDKKQGKATAGTKRFDVTVMASSFLLAASVLLTSLPSSAVSGGGLDFANLDITGQNFANGNYKRKDFTQVIAKGTNFANSNLQGCRFYKAYLVNADFSGADLRGASLEDTSLDNAVLKDVNAAGAYFSSSILDVKILENADFTDAQIPLKSLPLLCDRDDAKGVHPATGVDTRESLMCP